SRWTVIKDLPLHAVALRLPQFFPPRFLSPNRAHFRQSDACSLYASAQSSLACPCAGVQTGKDSSRQSLGSVGETALHCQHTTPELRSQFARCERVSRPSRIVA